MTATETFATLRQFWLKHYDAMDVLIMTRTRLSTPVSVQGHLASGDRFGNVVTEFSRRQTLSPVQVGIRESVQSGSSDDGGWGK